MDWIFEIDWQTMVEVGSAHHSNAITITNPGNVLEWIDRDYGLVWSRHILLDNLARVELSFGVKSWAAIDPIDPGTRSVIKDRGCKILFDPDSLLQQLVDRAN